MTIQPRNNANDGDTFESVLTSLLTQVRSQKQVTPELDVIVANGLEVAQEIDDLYIRQGSFTRLSQYLLYKVAFDLWSYQHQAILESLENTRQQGFRDHANQILQHEVVAENLFHALQDSTVANELDGLRGSWLIAWRQAISEISSFFPVPISAKKSARKPSGFRLRGAEMSPELRYAVIATCTFVLGIVIATLLLIRR